MTPSFVIQSTPRFERLARKLLKGHAEFQALQDRAIEILHTDPLNRSRGYPIKKLEGVGHGNGQCRLALGRFRFRYDIYGQNVVLQYCGLRRENTY